MKELEVMDAQTLLFIRRKNKIHPRWLNPIGDESFLWLAENLKGLADAQALPLSIKRNSYVEHSCKGNRSSVPMSRGYLLSHSGQALQADRRSESLPVLYHIKLQADGRACVKA